MQNVHPQTGNPQTVHPQTSYQQKSDRRILDPQSGHPQTVHPQNSSDNPQWITRSIHRLATPPATASGSSDSGTYPQYTLDHRHGSTTPQLATSRREQQTQNRTLTLVPTRSDPQTATGSASYMSRVHSYDDVYFCLLYTSPSPRD